MYFVTTTRKPYILFTMTPSERGAVGLTEARAVHFLVRPAGGEWRVVAEWDAARYSHTDFMVSLRDVAEPEDPARLLDHLPPGVLA